ncbi:SAV_2336 N-terminal domain-related protein [Streptomyces collinus]|uniref:SAV_2336 N-terminal domain-related protein n=1 Tax=Streptomyces collinus TaxID=42684 RepID=UPI00294289F1|nr:SAV_2336 N-terminal domain-related protein [Streptomyces collinus]
MPGMRLDELIGKLRQGGLDPTAEDVADAVWLARRLGAAPPSEARGQPAGALDGAPAADPENTGDAHDAYDEAADDARGAAGRGAARHADGASPASGPSGPTADAPAAPVPLLTPGLTAPPQPGAVAPAAFPVRAPAAAALPGLLGLEKALRALGRYRVASVRSGDERLDEEATADRAAASGILLPVTRPGRRRRCDVQLLMDTGPAMAVWGQLVEELRQACQQSGAFASVRVHHLYADDSGAPLIGTTAGPGRHTRLRPADELHDPTGRRITFVISDCVGPLWQNGSAQRLLHHWPRTAPLAVVQPLPPRLWGRTALPAEPGLLLRPAELGGRLGFRPDDEPWDEPTPGARPVPVLQPTPEAFEAFARLLGGAGPTSERAWAALTDPATPPPAAPAPAAPAPRSDHDLLRAFRAGASPGALRLAVYLAAAPLTLPVMQLVQRAMLPDTGPMELAEVLLGGLLRQLPGTEDHPCFAYPGRVQDLLLSSLDQDTAGLVLKHCSAYVERHFGKGTRNFAALAAARLADHDPAAGAGPQPEGTGSPGDGGSVEAELFASVPARVLRFYLPDLVTPDPLTEAERLLGQWYRLADPEVLRRAREQALAAVAPGAAADGPRPHLVLGRILRAEAGTAAARTTGGCAELLREAATALAAAHAAAPGDSRERAEAALELAGCRRELWQLTAESGPLTQALEVLDPGLAPWPGLAERAGEWFRARPHDGEPVADDDALPETGADAAEPGADPAAPATAARAPRTRDDVTVTAAPTPRIRDDVPWAVTAHRSRLLLRGRVLLDLRHPGAAADELREACALLDAEGAPDTVRAPALLELARALRESGAEDGETRQALLRARRSAGDDPGLLLPCLAALAAFHDAAGETREADAAYERAALLAPAEGALRCRLLTSWGESLLRRASARDGAGTVDRAEYVLREALKSLPARSTQRGRLQGLVGSALAQRFRHLGFLPDLFESRHLLGQALRAAADAAVRAEVWLQLGRVRLEGWYHAGAPVLMDALQAYENAEREAQAAHGADPGSVTAARARYGSGTVLALMGRPGAARGAYRAAREQWQRLVAALREVDWADVELARAAPGEPLASAGRLMPEEQWREAAPPWWPWTQEWNNSADLDRS